MVRCNHKILLTLAGLTRGHDEVTMLSLGRASADLAVQSAEALIETVSTQKNVTQMASFIAEMAHNERGNTLDENVKKALQEIKTIMLQPLEDSLKKEHGDDQDLLNGLNQCFRDAKSEYENTKAGSAQLQGYMINSKNALTTCRTNVHKDYETVIETCTTMDEWVAELNLKWYSGMTQECVWDSRDKIGGHILGGLDWYKANHKIWLEYHTTCLAAIRTWNEKDMACDTVQSTFERNTCALRQDQWSNCHDHLMTECSRCSAEFDDHVHQAECREKDRKVDWSAAQKIRCYIDVLMASPSDEELQENCKDGENCLSEFRIAQYKECEQRCTEVDYEREDGEYAEVDGVNSTHRASGADAEAKENRCTRDLDLDFPMKEECEPCPPLPPFPCEHEFIEEHYASYLSTAWASPIEEGTKECSGYVHQEWFAFGQAECRPCPVLVGKDPTNHDARCQAYGNEIRVVYRGENTINIMEVVVNGQRPARATMSSAYNADFPASNCIDGDVNTLCHTHRRDSHQYLSVHLDSPQCINTIEVYNRPGFEYRLVGSSIEVLTEGTRMWTGAFLTEQNKYDWEFQSDSAPAPATPNYGDGPVLQPPMPVVFR
jgi:hypothetical protein